PTSCSRCSRSATGWGSSSAAGSSRAGPSTRWPGRSSAMPPCWRWSARRWTTVPCPPCGAWTGCWRSTARARGCWCGPSGTCGPRWRRRWSRPATGCCAWTCAATAWKRSTAGTSGRDRAMATTPTAGTGAGPAERGPGEAPAAGSGPAAVQPGPGDAAAPVEGFAARLGRLVADLVREPYRSGLAPIVRKELADNLLGSRFVILAGLVFVTTLAGLYVAAQTIRNNVGTGVFDQFVFLKLFTTGDPQRQLPSLVSFLAFFTPLVGLALGFDAING